MGSRARAVLGVMALVAAPMVMADPADAATGSFAATCVRPDAPGSVAAHRTFSYETHAPDSVAPGARFSVDTDVDYAVPTDVPLGIAMYIMTPGQFGAFVETNPGAASIAGPVEFVAPGQVGGVLDISLARFGASGALSQPEATEVCTPDQPLVVARVAVGVPQVSIGDAAVVEGSSGTRAMEFPVTLSRPAATDVTVTFGTESGTATAGADFTTLSGTVTVHAGFVSGIATVRVRGDATVEPKENLRVRLHDPTGAVLRRAVGTGRIIDDDPEPGPRISIGDGSVVEGNRGTRSARFVVSLSQPAAQTVTFHYATVDGTAVAGTDYRAQEFDYRIPAGNTSITVPVPVVPDSATEANESFTVRLVSAGATIGRANGVGTILDDD